MLLWSIYWSLPKGLLGAQLAHWILNLHSVGPESVLYIRPIVIKSSVMILGWPLFILFRPSSSPAGHTPTSMAVTCSTHSTATYMANTFSRSATTNTSTTDHHSSNPPTVHPTLWSWCPGNATRIAFHSCSWRTPSWLLWRVPTHVGSASWAPPSHFPIDTVWDNTSDELHYHPPGSSTPCSYSVPSAHIWQRTTGCCADRRLSTRFTNNIYLLLSRTTTRSVCKKCVPVAKNHVCVTVNIWYVPSVFDVSLCLNSRLGVFSASIHEILCTPFCFVLMCKGHQLIRKITVRCKFNLDGTGELLSNI